LIPNIDVHVADMPFPTSAGAEFALEHTEVGGEEVLIDIDGTHIDVGSPCNGSASYEITVSVVWTNRTHPDFPTIEAFWSPLLFFTHADRY
jgi:hypothetical protein